MPKISYTWVFATAIAAYFLNYDLLGVCIVTIIVITVWNFLADASSNFGYVSKEKYTKVVEKNQTLRQMIKDLEKEHEENLERVRKEGRLAGQKAVFYVYLYEFNKFKHHLNLYKEDEERKAKSNNSTGNNQSKKSSNKVDWRKILEVASDANKETVDKAYRDLVKKYHPDINKDPGASARMQQINEAKEAADSYFSIK